MSVIERGHSTGQVIARVQDGEAALPEGQLGVIGADFRVGPDLAGALLLKSNDDLCCVGMKTIGNGFVLNRGERDWFAKLSGPHFGDYVRPYLNGRDLTQKSRDVFVIDFFGKDERWVSDEFPQIYQHLLTTVKPLRLQNRNEQFRREWWVIGHPRQLFRDFTKSLRRYISTLETSKHRFFVFLPTETVPDSALVTIGLEDAFHLGVLSSRIHVSWVLATGGTLEDRPRYNKTRCFDPFPFPTDVLESLKARIRAEAEALDALRKGVLAEHSDLTLTKLYNVLEALREGRSLTDAERDVHDRGLVTLIRRHHDAIDESVAEAYGWGEEHRAGTLDEETILTRLVQLNKERAAEEARGLIRYLRPEFQDPGYRAPVEERLDLGEVAATPVSNVIPWPASLPEQVGAVQAVLTAARQPLGAQDVARRFKGKRAASVRPVLDALAGLGMARRLNDGRYAA